MHLEKIMQRQLLPELSRAEWLAVAVALNDAAANDCAIPARGRSLRTRLAKLGSFITGSYPSPPLADPKLEAVRRYVCMTRTRASGAEESQQALFEHGFTPAQAQALALLSSLR